MNAPQLKASPAEKRYAAKMTTQMTNLNLGCNLVVTVVVLNSCVFLSSRPDSCITAGWPYFTVSYIFGAVLLLGARTTTGATAVSMYVRSRGRFRFLIAMHAVGINDPRRFRFVPLLEHSSSLTIAFLMVLF